jgi:DNA topoisomerase-1
MEAAADDHPSKQTVTTCVKAVAGLLGNTPAVCRASYIHPSVFEAYEAGRLSPDLAGERAKAERALLALLKRPIRQARAA